MSELPKITEVVSKFCKLYSLFLLRADNGKFQIFTGELLGITLFLTAETPANFSFHFSERTHDIIYRGDRSDAHVIMSLMFAGFLKTFDSEISCELFDIAHPAVNDEIWGRYIMPVQFPHFQGISTWQQLEEGIIKLIGTMVFARDVLGQFISCPCDDCLKKANLENNYPTGDLPSEMAHSENKSLRATSHLNTGGRIRPKWDYFYDIQNEITVVKSEELTKYFEFILSLYKSTKVSGIKGDFILQGELKNFLYDSHSKEIKKVIKALGQNTKEEFKVLPLENMIISVSKPYIIAIGRLCGIHEYKSAREVLRNRHNEESKHIFPITTLEWEDDICPEQFEGLIKTLLEREPNVRSVRKSSPTNQGDGGRDLVIEWNILNSQVMSKDNPPISLIKVVGQCKTSSKTVGKTKVLDIRDTLDSHNSQGYFLAVSSQISAPLTQKLEELRMKGIWTEWWNRDDIESRLSKNEDLLPLFPKVIRVKQNIKFVER